MTRPQKLFLAILTLLAVIICVTGCVTLFVAQDSIARSVFALIMSVPTPRRSSPTATRPAPTPTVTPTPVKTASATSAPLSTVVPTATSTRVVRQTATATPKPTVVTCIDNIANFEASGVMTNEEVKQYLQAAIPPQHLLRCVKIRYVPQTANAQGTPVAGRFIPVFRQISVYPVSQETLTPQDILSTLTHEVGHNVYYNLRLDAPALLTQWTKLYQQGVGFVSDYAGTSDVEDFAESYRAYVLQPALLQQASPVKYEFMRANVFGGYEYSP
jgi:hypothetical protein